MSEPDRWYVHKLADDLRTPKTFKAESSIKKRFFISIVNRLAKRKCLMLLNDLQPFPAVDYSYSHFDRACQGYSTEPSEPAYVLRITLSIVG